MIMLSGCSNRDPVRSCEAQSVWQRGSNIWQCGSFQGRRQRELFCGVRTGVREERKVKENLWSHMTDSWHIQCTEITPPYLFQSGGLLKSTARVWETWTLLLKTWIISIPFGMWFQLIYFEPKWRLIRAWGAKNNTNLFLSCLKVQLWLVEGIFISRRGGKGKSWMVTYILSYAVG